MKLSLNLAPEKSFRLEGLPKQHMERYIKDISEISDPDIKNIMAGFPVKKVGDVVSILQGYFL